MSAPTKPNSRLRRRRRVRAKVAGTAERPRLSVFRSNRGIQAQLIDDVNGHTLAAVAWIESELKKLGRTEQARGPESSSRSAQRRPGWRPASSTAAATSTTDGSGLWPRAPGRAASGSSRGSLR